MKAERRRRSLQRRAQAVGGGGRETEMGGGGTETEVGAGGTRMVEKAGVGEGEKGKEKKGNGIGGKRRQSGALGLQQKGELIVSKKRKNY